MNEGNGAATLSDSGTLSFSDLDTTDVVTVSAGLQQRCGVERWVAQRAARRGAGGRLLRSIRTAGTTAAARTSTSWLRGRNDHLLVQRGGDR